MAADTHSVRETAPTAIAFGQFRLFPTQRLLTEAGKPVHLGSRAFDVLTALIRRAGELVSKDELMATVWPNTFVAPANLAVHISALRRALGDGRGGKRYVVNIPGRGYRFVAPVTVERDVPSNELRAASMRESDIPTHWRKPVDRTEVIDELAQKLQERGLLTVVGRNGVGNARVALAVVEILLSGNENEL